MAPFPLPDDHPYTAADDPSPLPRWLQVHPVLAGLGFGLFVFLVIVLRWDGAYGIEIVGSVAYGVFNWWGWRPNGCFWRMRRNIWVEGQASDPGRSGSA